MRLRFGVSKKIGKFHVGVSHTVGGRKKRRSKSSGKGFETAIAILFLPITGAIFFGKWLYEKTQEQKAIDPDSVWYKQTYGIILMLIFFFPVGLYLMWKYGKGWNQYLKIGVSAFCGLVLIASMFMPNSSGGNNSMTDSGLAAMASVTTTWQKAEITRATTTEKPEATSESVTTETTTVEPTEEPTEAPTEEPTEAPRVVPTEKQENEYMINYETNVFHSPSCYTIRNSDNVKAYTGTADDLKEQGYTPCGKCKPR